MVIINKTYMKRIGLIFAIFIIWRIALLVPVFFGHELLPFQMRNYDMQIWAYTRPYKPVDNIVISPWANFDGVHYLTIIGDGYGRGAVGRFFPLYPMIVAALSGFLGGAVIFGSVQFTTALIVANVFFFLSLVVLYKLIRLDYSDRIALWSIVFLLAFPTSFFYGAIYSESTYLFISLLSLYFMRKRQFIFAGLSGLFLGLVRITGITIIFPMLYELYKNKSKKLSNKEILFKWGSLVLVPLGLTGFMAYSYNRWHDALYFIHAQQAVTSGRSHLIFFLPQTIYRYLKILGSLSPYQFEWWISLLELGTFFVVIYLLYAAWKKKIYPSYVLFAVFSFLIPAVSGTFSGLPRYASVLFPIFMVLALIKNTWVKVFLCIFFAVLLFLLTMFFSRGYFVA